MVSEQQPDVIVVNEGSNNVTVNPDVQVREEDEVFYEEGHFLHNKSSVMNIFVLHFWITSSNVASLKKMNIETIYTYCFLNSLTTYY